MLQLTLRLNDGIGDTRPWMRPLVQRMQRALSLTGHPLKADGQFGKISQKALLAFQKASQIPETGEMEKQSWNAIQPQLLMLFGAVQSLIASLLPGFRGDLDWVHAQEGHLGKPYWPGGASGITLDPGVDLGHADEALIEAVLRERLGENAWAMLKPLLGIKGEAAKQALAEHPELASIQMSKAMAYEIMPHVTQPYWKAISKRFPRLKEAGTPATVQTAMLSIAYNRGPGNRHLEAIRECIHLRHWDHLADKIARMQQEHPLSGIRLRRRLEANLIRTELNEG